MSVRFKTDGLPTNYAAAFKDADIRGRYPSEIDEVVAYRVARAFVEECGLKKVLVGRDMRVSSPDLRRAFIAGVQDSGASVVDLGQVGTAAVYFASGEYDLPGVVITASHNPAEYNGLKLITAGAVPVTSKTGLRAIKKRIAANDFVTPKRRGSCTKQAIAGAYKKYVLRSAPVTLQQPVRIVVDVGNGMGATVLPILEAVPQLEVTTLFAELDGTFPNRPSNPTLKKSQTAIRAELRQGGYDFGIAFDGDADRVAFFDEKGRYINSAIVGALLAAYLLEHHPGATFVYTVFTSRMYEETIRARGGKAKIARVGHAFIKEVMRKQDAEFACEHSAHFYFRDNYYADSGILAALHILAAYARAESGTRFSKLLKPFMQYHQTEEVLVRVTDKRAALQAVADHYAKQSPEHIKKFDGVSVQFSDYWFAVKESVTEDALKFVVEAPKKATAVAKQKELQKVLGTYTIS